MSGFSRTLRRIRLERQMTQEEFARFLGTSKQNISRYENGEVSPKISTAAQIAGRLGLTLTELNNSKLDLPVFFDPELITNDKARTDGLSGKQFTQNTIAYCERIREAGYQPAIYSNLYWEARLFDLYELRDYPIWYADYQAVPQTPYDFKFWQYSESGSVGGITGGTDLDVMFVKKKKKS